MWIKHDHASANCVAEYTSVSMISNPSWLGSIYDNPGSGAVRTCARPGLVPSVKNQPHARNHNPFRDILLRVIVQRLHVKACVRKRVLGQGRLVQGL